MSEAEVRAASACSPRTSRAVSVCLAACGWLVPAGCAPVTPPSSANSRSEAVWLASELEQLRTLGLARMLEAPLDNPIPVVLGLPPAEQSASIQSCKSYFDLKAQGYEAVSDQDHDLMRLAGVRCHALQLAAKLTVAACPEGRRILEAAVRLSALPATVGPSPAPAILEQRQASSRRGESWAEYAPSASAAVRDAQLVVDEGELTTELAPLASGDLNGDGQPELLARVVGYGREGNWRDIRVLVLTRACERERYELTQSVLP